MDNLVFEVEVEADIDELALKLTQAGRNPRISPGNGHSPPKIQFSVRIGKWPTMWLFALDLRSARLRASGGVATVFFGHNVLVPRNEAAQLRLIIELIREELRRYSVSLPADESLYSIKRAELTCTHRLPEGVDPKAAIDRLYLAVKAKFGKRATRQGDDDVRAGTVVVGLQKSKRTFRIYDPNEKRPNVPKGIDRKDWMRLFDLIADCIRIEGILGPRELKTRTLDCIRGWDHAANVQAALLDIYITHNLVGKYQPTVGERFLQQLGATHPTYVEYVRAWVSDGEDGYAPDPGSGAITRFRRYMKACGYDVSLPYAKHQFLAHGLRKSLKPSMALPIPQQLRGTSVFCVWWKGK